MDLKKESLVLGVIPFIIKGIIFNIIYIFNLYSLSLNVRFEIVMKIECIHASCDEIMANNCHFCDHAIKKVCQWSLNQDLKISHIREFKIKI